MNLSWLRSPRQAVSAAKKTAEEEFKKRNYAAAADAYATAAACAGSGADKADLLVKKAQCFVMLQRWVRTAGGATPVARERAGPPAARR